MFSAVGPVLRRELARRSGFKCFHGLACFGPYSNCGQSSVSGRWKLRHTRLEFLTQYKKFSGLRSLHLGYSNTNSKPPPEFEINQEKQEDGSKGPKNTKKIEMEPVPMGRRLKIVAFILATWGVVYFAANYNKDKKKIEEREGQVSQIDIGAKDYELVDHTGKVCTKRDFLGKWLLLYFGFTHCPDICPEELEKMADIINIIDKDTSIPELVPVFISVDPERDTPEVVRKYIKEFHEKFIGLTGSKEQVKQAAKTFRVYFSAGPRDEDNDYIVDHSIVMYLMSPQGNFVDYYGARGVPMEKIVESIRQNMKNYTRLHGR